MDRSDEVCIQQTKVYQCAETYEHTVAKAFRTTSSEALCIVTGMTPIIIKTEEAVKQYYIRKMEGSLSQLIDREVELNNWPHPVDVVKIIEDNRHKEQRIPIYTYGSKNDHGNIR